MNVSAVLRDFPRGLIPQGSVLGSIDVELRDISVILRLFRVFPALIVERTNSLRESVPFTLTGIEGTTVKHRKTSPFCFPSTDSPPHG